jgi:hypothetical protein
MFVFITLVIHRGDGVAVTRSGRVFREVLGTPDVPAEAFRGC